MALPNIKRRLNAWGPWRRIGARLNPYDNRPFPSFDDPREEGAYGEMVAMSHLRRQGYKHLLSNYRSRWGEIDLICRNKDILAFVEVKTRGPRALASPGASVNASKQRRLIRTAQAYLQELIVRDVTARFDVVEVLLVPGEKPRCQLIKAAFLIPS